MSEIETKPGREWELEQRLDDLHGELSRLVAAQRNTESNDRERYRITRKQDRVHEQIGEVQDEMADLFAERHGLRRTRKIFSLRVLAERKVHAGNRHEDHRDFALTLRGSFTGSSMIDHPYYFRDEDNRAAALAVHLYGVPDGIEEAAEEAGLDVSFPNFPTWWCPGGTQLVVYTPKREESLR